MQAEEVAAYFAEDSLSRFGNTEPARGRAAVQDANASFFNMIGGLQHQFIGIWTGQWEYGPVISVEVEVIYTRKDGTKTDALPATSTLLHPQKSST